MPVDDDKLVFKKNADSLDVTIPEENIVGKRGEGWAVANATLGHERGSLSDPNVMMNRLNSLIERMKDETINGENINETKSEKSISSLHVNNDIELLAISGVVLP